MDMTVVIPTRDRRALLCETLTRLARHSGGVELEVIVIDDGSSDDSPQAVRELTSREGLEVQLFEQPSLGPAAARNRALAAARSPVALFLNDDTLPAPQLVERHARFHREHPEPQAALLGRIALATEPSPTPFMRWLAEQHFDYEAIEDPRHVRGGRFYTGNVSAKIEFLRDAGGFDESFPMAAYEDIDLGLRLEKRGMWLSYDAEAVVEHHHPLDLESAVARYQRSAVSLPALVERHPDWPAPRRPSVRHRLGASALTALTAVGVRAVPVRREVWRFLCHEAVREAYWNAIDGNDRQGPPPGELRIGARLGRWAAKDRDARMPSTWRTPSADNMPARP